MKINFKLNVLAVVVTATLSGPALAAIDGAASGNGELLLNMRYYGGASSTSGDDDISALFDLGFKMNDMLAANGQAGFNKSWDLTTGPYGASWNQLMSFVGPANAHLVEFNVIALDTTDLNAAGGSRYLTTANVDTYPSLGNTNLKGFVNMDKYVEANNSRGTHATDDNGASVAMPTDPTNTFFGAINGFGQGDTWLQKTTVDTTQAMGSELNFWFLTTSSTSSLAQATKTPFGVDLTGDGVIGEGEFSKFTLNDSGVLTFANPSVSPIPEADTWAMLLAGLGMLGMIVRRRSGI
jgi:MYXO-CTERM domain-containing protein